MKKKWLSLLGAVLALILMVASSYANELNGTYVHTKRSKDSITFSGDKMTMVSYGMKLTSTYEAKDGRIHWTNAAGHKHRTPYKLEGNTLTFDEGKHADIFIKK